MTCPIYCHNCVLGGSCWQPKCLRPGSTRPNRYLMVRYGAREARLYKAQDVCAFRGVRVKAGYRTLTEGPQHVDCTLSMDYSMET